MKNVTIKTIKMHYFKGIENRKVDFDEKFNVISGPNGSGKSTVVDAFYWCMWGKNADGRSDFSVKTVDKDGNEIPNVDHEVAVVLDVDGTEQAFRRVLVPEYAKDGSLKGNHTDYYWNDVPMKKSEYDQKVAGVVSEDIFKLSTSPYGFLTLDWKKQRDMLIAMAGNINDNEVGDGRYSDLVERMQSKTLDEMKRELNAKLSKINESMKAIPTRIDEVKRGMPDSVDLAALKEERVELEKELAEIERKEKDEAALINEGNAGRNELMKKIGDLEFRQQQVLNEAQAKERNAIHEGNQTYLKAEAEYKLLCDEEKRDADSCKRQDAAIVAEIDFGKKKVSSTELKIEELRKEWSVVSARTFEADDFLKCPLYGHVCNDGHACSEYNTNQGAAWEKWNAEKTTELNGITERGKAMAEELAGYMSSLQEKEDEIKALKEGYKSRSDKRVARCNELDAIMREKPKKPLISSIMLNDVPECVELDKEIKDLKEMLSKTEEVKMTENSEFLSRKLSIRERLHVIGRKEANASIIEQGIKRINELSEALTKLGEEKMSVEDALQECTDFEVDRMNMVSDKVNDQFELVKFRMWKRQVNGEIVPDCLCLCDGVTWKDANTAKQINAGIEVATKIAAKYGCMLPMLFDNAERCGSFYEVPGQMILLRFDKDAAGFRVRNNFV